MALAEIRSFGSKPLPHWMGWDVACLGRLLDTDPEVGKIGTALCQVLAGRLLDCPEVPFEFLLYRHAELEDRYCYVGMWTDPSEPVSPVVSANIFSSTIAGIYTGSNELDVTGDQSSELFLPIESHEGVLGFGLFRILNGSPLPYIEEDDLFFLGRIVGQSFEQLLQSDRIEFAHQSMRTTVRYLEAVIELSPDGMLLLDEEGRIVVASEGIEDYFGQLPVDVIGELMQDVLPPEGTAALLSGARLSEMRGEPVTRPLRRRGLDPSSMGEVEAVFQSIRHDHGSSGVLVRLRDLGPVEDKTWFQTQPQLPGMGTGDLIRPLAAVRGYLGLLRDDARPQGPALDLFQAMDAQLEWMAAQVGTRALAEEFQTGAVRWRECLASPSQLVTRAMEQIRFRFMKRGIQLCLDIPEEMPRLNVDVDRVCIALGCVLDRAVLHPNTKRVTIAVVSHTDESSELVFRISSELGPGGRSSNVQSCADAGTEQFAHAIPLVRSVVHHCGGALKIDWEAQNAFTAEIRIPVATEDSPSDGA